MKKMAVSVRRILSEIKFFQFVFRFALKTAFAANPIMPMLIMARDTTSPASNISRKKIPIHSCGNFLNHAEKFFIRHEGKSYSIFAFKRWPARDYFSATHFLKVSYICGHSWKADSN